jgi:hypothetical protein
MIEARFRAVRGALLLAALLTALHASAAFGQMLIPETSARFEWGPASGAVDFYEVYVSRSSRKGQYLLEQTVAGGANEARIEGAAGEILRVRVRAGNDLGFGPLSAPSDPVRFGLPSELPLLGTPGVLRGRTGGADTSSIFYADPDTGTVWRFSAVDPSAAPVEIGHESDAAWELAASADFDGDGRSDLFWRREDGATRIWYLDAAGYEEEPGPSDPGPDWRAELSGDFDANGQDDLVWRAPLGATRIWFRIEAEFASAGFPSMPVADWELVAAGDFDGDGHTDVFWRNLRTTDTALWLMVVDPYNGVYARARPCEKRSLLWEAFETRDHDGDGRDDVHWRVKQSPDVAEWWLMDAERVRRE